MNITPQHILYFCNPDCPRDEFLLPTVLDGFIYATDGFAILRVSIDVCLPHWSWRENVVFAGVMKSWMLGNNPFDQAANTQITPVMPEKIACDCMLLSSRQRLNMLGDDVCTQCGGGGAIYESVEHGIYADLGDYPVCLWQIGRVMAVLGESFNYSQTKMTPRHSKAPAEPILLSNGQGVDVCLMGVEAARVKRFYNLYTGVEEVAL